MKRSFITNIVFLLGINLLIKPIYIFGIDRGVQNAVGEVDYGIYFNLFIFGFLWQIINDFGFQNYNNRAVSQNAEAVTQNFAKLFVLKTVFAALYFIVVFAAAGLSGYQAYFFPFLVFIALNHILSSLILFLRSNVSGLGYYRTDSLFSSLDRLLLIFLVGGLLYFGPETFKIEWFVFSQTFTLALTAAVVFAWLSQKQTINWSLPKDWSWIPQLLKETFPYALVVFLMTLYTRLDVFMVEKLSTDGLQEVATYAAGYRLLDAVNMFGFLFASLLLPMFSRMLGAGEKVNDLLGMSWKLVWSAAIPLSLGLFWFRQPIMNALYVDSTPYYGEVMGILMLNFIAMSGTYIYGTLLTAHGNLRKLNLLFAFSILGNVALNSVLIPKYGALGAAYSTLFTQSFAFLVQVAFSHWALSRKPFIDDTLRLLLFSGLCLATFYGLTRYLESSWLIHFIIGLISSGLFALLTGLIDIRGALTLLKSKVNAKKNQP